MSFKRLLEAVHHHILCRCPLVPEEFVSVGVAGIAPRHYMNFICPCTVPKLQPCIRFDEPKLESFHYTMIQLASEVYCYRDDAWIVYFKQCDKCARVYWGLARKKNHYQKVPLWA